MTDSFWFDILQDHRKSGDNDKDFKNYTKWDFKYRVDYDFAKREIESALKNVEKIIFLNKNSESKSFDFVTKSTENNYYCFLVKDIQNIIIDYLNHGIPYHRLLICKHIIDNSFKGKKWFPKLKMIL